MSDLAETLLEQCLSFPPLVKYLAVVLISILPIIELRGALPAAMNVFGLQWWLAYLLSIVGNLIPVPFLLLFFSRVQGWLRRFYIFEKFFEWLFARTRRKGNAKIQLWGEMGLILFVAIPLPVTGAWTGSLVSNLFELNRAKSFLSIFIGVVIAGFIVTVIIIMDSLLWGVLIIAFLIIVLFALGKLEECLLSGTFERDTP